MTHSFSHPHSELHFTTYRPTDVAPALEAGEKEARQKIEAFLKIPDEKRTFENTMLAFSRCDDTLTVVAEIVCHLDSVLSGDWVEAAQLAEEKVSAFGTEIMHDKRIYEALKAIKSDNLPANYQRLLHETIRNFERGGIALPDETQQKVKKLTRKISQLGVTFEQNIIAANAEAGIHVTDVAELAGCDKDLIDEARQAAQKRQLDGYWVAFSEPTTIAVLKDCQVKTTRQAMHRVSSARAVHNKPVAQQILAARYELARLLGFKNHAEYVLEQRMAKKPETAQAFIADVTRRYKAKAQEEHESLLQFARTYEDDPELILSPSDADMWYYADLQREKEHGFNEKAVSDYLPLPVVREAMFRVLATLYGVTFTLSDKPAWHDDVEVYSLHDKTGAYIATVWCDWYARTGKRGGAWQNTYFTDDYKVGESRSPTLGYVVCNFPTPRGDRSSLLNIRDVETMWHEFGHFMHGALSATELREQSGYACKWDFVEAPSQIMENWVWQPEIFGSFARHYKTNEPLEVEVINKIIQSRRFRVASFALRQSFFATLDLDLYTQKPTNDVVAFAKKLKAEFSFVPPADYEASVTNFTHIFSGGYSAGYYGYKWAEAIEADFFSRFAAEGVLNSSVGHDYAVKVLARGNEVEPEELIRDFLGRDSSIDALLRRDGIVN